MSMAKDQPKISYSEKLKDARWQKRRLELLEAAKWDCEECGRHMPARGLQIHHIYYLVGRDPWDYPDDLLMVLCSTCHEDRQKLEEEFFCKVAQVVKYRLIQDLKNTPVWAMFETQPFYPKKEQL